MNIEDTVENVQVVSQADSSQSVKLRRRFVEEEEEELKLVAFVSSAAIRI